MTQETNSLLTSIVEGYAFDSACLELGAALIEG